jgi:hypothetical protein
MPIFLDHSLRKALVSTLRTAFNKDPELAAQVKILDQETFLPETPNQILITDLSVQNENLDARNRITELKGKVTFVPLDTAHPTFLFWAQENPAQTPLINFGFYQLTLQKGSPVASPTADHEWWIQTDVIKRVTQVYTPWMGLKIDLSAVFQDARTLDPALLTVEQSHSPVVYGVDYVILNTSVLLRRYDSVTRIFYEGQDITDQCTYWNLVQKEMTLRGLDSPIGLPATAVVGTVSVYNVKTNKPVLGWRVSNRGTLEWQNPTKKGTQVRIQYYERKPLDIWDLPDEFKIQLEQNPMVFSSGESSLKVISNLRGPLSSQAYEIQNSEPPVLRILEPFPKESVSIDYRFLVKTLPKVKVAPETINDQLIPGLSITFTGDFFDGARAVIVVHDQEKMIGEENGGTNKVELTLKIRSADDKTLDRMTSRTYFCFTARESLEALSDQGVTVENNVSYVRSTEDRDANSDKWFINSLRITVHHTWRYLIPYITDLNSLDLVVGAMEVPYEAGDVSSFKDLLYTTTMGQTTFVQDYR